MDTPLHAASRTAENPNRWRSCPSDFPWPSFYAACATCTSWIGSSQSSAPNRLAFAAPEAPIRSLSPIAPEIRRANSCRIAFESRYYELGRPLPALKGPIWLTHPKDGPYLFSLRQLTICLASIRTNRQPGGLKRERRLVITSKLHRLGPGECSRDRSLMTLSSPKACSGNRYWA